MVAPALKSFRKLFRAVSSQDLTARVPERARRAMGLESLEQRRMLTLLGVTPDVPLFFYNSTGITTYNGTNDSFDITATPTLFSLDGSQVSDVNPPASLALHIKVDNTGALTGGVPGDDFVITGEVDVDNDSTVDYSGTLLTAEITGFGYQESGVDDLYDMRLTVTGGLMASLYNGKDLGMTVTSENSTFTGFFLTPFLGGAKGNVGAIDQEQQIFSTIFGHKYNDVTGNGLSGDDTPLGGTTINLYQDADNDSLLTGADGAAIASTVTAVGTGEYSFGSLTTGRYFVQEIVPAGYQQTAPTSPNYYIVNITAGTDVTARDFANVALSSLSGIKYEDETGNGVSGDDSPLNGTTINLYNDVDNNGQLTGADGAPIDTQVTSGGGAYSFTGLVPGNYLVQEIAPAGYTQTAPSATGVHAVAVGAGTTNTGYNFANFKLVSISGKKVTDITGDGISGDDTALAGTTINLYRDLNNDSVLTGADGSPIAFAVTGVGGTYSFINISPGRYFVEEIVPAGYSQTAPVGPNYYVIVATSGDNVVNRDFANTQSGSISGKKVTDITANGLSGDDTGLGGTTINLFFDTDNDGFLTGADGGAVGTTVTTAGTGAYSFSGLTPGRYFVQEVVPATYTQSAPTSPDYYTVVLTSGAAATGKDFANYQKGSVGGTKYTDITGNGPSGDDTPLGGTTINLYFDANNDTVLTGADGAAVATTVTAVGTGTYSFGNLTPGRYFVQEVAPAGYSQTSPGGTGYYTVVLNSGSNASGKDFHNTLIASISGKKVTDITANGLSADDTGLGGTTINLFKDVNNDGLFTGADGAAIGSTVTTAGTGAYSFSNLAPGRYFVQEVVPATYTQSAPASPGYYTVVLTSGSAATGKDFANYQKGSVSGNKYKDITGNGYSADDTGLGGTTINIFKDVNNDGQVTGADGAAVGSVVSATTTGAWSFSNLTPGNYIVQEVVPAGYARTSPTANNGTFLVTVNSGSSTTGLKFTNVLVSSICGVKYKDLTGNGITADDPFLAGTTINLYKDNGDSVFTGADANVGTQVTAANGSYLFSNLVPGTYYIQEVVPSGYARTFPTGNGIHTVALGAGSSVTGKNFANAPLGKISGTKYKDLSGNGASADDTPLGGTTIKLFKDMNADGVLTVADGAAVASTVTVANGTYSFTNLAPGKYFVQEVVPTGYVRTGPALTDTYTITVAYGSDCTGNNFANFELHDCDIINVKYYVNNVQYTALNGHTFEGATVKVTFTVPAGETDTVTLVSYKAPSNAFDPNTASQQTIYQQAGGTFGPGTYTLTVMIPDSYYQVDFVCGLAIDKLGPNGSKIFYGVGAQERLLSWDNGGDNSDVDKQAQTTAWWSSTTGQNLIKAFNGSSTSLVLGNYLATTWSKLFGSLSAYNLAGKTNAQVAAQMVSLNGNSAKVLEARLLATALSVYASKTSLGGSTATSYGFVVNATGLGGGIFNTGSSYSAFQQTAAGNKSVIDLLNSVNNQVVSTSLYGGNSSQKSLASTLFGNILSAGAF